MGFNSKGFMATIFERRKMYVPVPQLKEWFSTNEDALWQIQSLKGAELGKADEAANNRKFAEDLLEALMSNVTNEAVEEVKRLVGRIADKPFEIKKRIYILQFGTVADQFDNADEMPLDIAVRIADEFGILFLHITNKILELTGEGSKPGKPSPSGAIQK